MQWLNKFFIILYFFNIYYLLLKKILNKITKTDEIDLRKKACNLHKIILEKLLYLDQDNGNNLNATLTTIQKQLEEKLYA